ncbi:MAG TPA: insulinase family protein [Ferruginibacter sp.]|jgi:zinc protease|nr:insulinase family protein [Ferruginibacter sp.]
MYTYSQSKLSIVLIALLSLMCNVVLAQISPADMLTIDPKVTIGKLPNGLTYYIRQNKKPEQKVELRLVVNAGSICEDDDQQGLAHMCEHQAFNGTTHFKRNDIVSFLQSIGVSFGNDLNAYTSFDETVYILPIPMDKPTNIETGFQILEDWAHNVTYLDDDIDGERPVILEESRLGKGADERMGRKIYPDYYAGSRYASRLPIGKDSIIQNFKYDVLRRFYHDWYRPDLMAVIVVGDIDPAQAEALIKKHFSALTNPINERPRLYATVPSYAKNKALVVTDKEATEYYGLLNYSAEKKYPDTTVADFKNYITKNIFSTLLNQRLKELTQEENPPFVNASGDFESNARGYESFSGGINTGSNDAVKGITAFVQELERVKKYGFTQAELDRAKKNILNSVTQQFNERDKTESSDYVDEYISNFLEKEPTPGIEKEQAYYQYLLPQITLQDVNALSDNLKQHSNKFVAIMGPEATGKVVLPTNDALLSDVTATEKLPVKPYEEKAIAASLIQQSPHAGTITHAVKNDMLGTTELTLSNGITVTLKSTDYKDDEVLMSAIRAGGKNNYGLTDKYNANYATAVMSAMGVGDFSPTDLKKILAGKTASVSPTFTESADGFSGSSSVKDVETMLQLLYLYVTEPRKDTALFESFVEKNKSQSAFAMANPQSAFIDTIYNALFNNNPLTPIIIPKSDYFDKIDLDRVLQIYKERFGDMSGMHFTFVGSFKEAELEPLLEKYLASLPVTTKKFNYVDNKVRPQKGKVNINVNKGTEAKSLILAFYTGEIPYTQDIDLKAQAVCEVLNIKIIEELREKIQGIYTGEIYTRFSKIPYQHYSFILELPCGPAKIDTLIIAANQQIENLKKNGPLQEDMEKVKQQWLEENKTAMKENNTWLQSLQDIEFKGNDPDRFLNAAKYITALTAKDVQDAAKLLLNGNNVTTAILRPATTQ